MAVISNELNNMKKVEKEKCDKIMMTGNGQSGGILASFLASVGLPLLISALIG